MSAPVVDQICNLADTLQGGVGKILDFFFLKMKQMKRTTAMLEQLGFNVQLPALEKLLAVSQITEEMYAKLQSSCPQLKLPAMPQGIAQIQGQVQQAYGLLSQGLSGHPWQQMGGLQAVVDMFAEEANKELGKLMGKSGGGGEKLGNLMSCLSAVCGGSASAATQQVASSDSVQIDQTGRTGSIQILNTNQRQLQQYVQSYQRHVELRRIT